MLEADPELFALLELYTDLGGASWKNGYGWQAQADQASNVTSITKSGGARRPSSPPPPVRGPRNPPLSQIFAPPYLLSFECSNIKVNHDLVVENL